MWQVPFKNGEEDCNGQALLVDPDRCYIADDTGIGKDLTLFMSNRSIFFVCMNITMHCRCIHHEFETFLWIVLNIIAVDIGHDGRYVLKIQMV